jgi:hypothetical protein
MPKPIVCLSEHLCQYMEAFQPCFSRRQWKYFVTVLLGLIECEERKMMTGLLRVVGERISLSVLSRFLSKWPWSAEQVAQTWMDCFREQMQPWSKQNTLVSKRKGSPASGVPEQPW